MIDDPKLERLLTTLHAQSDALILLMMEDRADTGPLSAHRWLTQEC